MRPNLNDSYGMQRGKGPAGGTSWSRGAWWTRGLPGPQRGLYFHGDGSECRRTGRCRSADVHPAGCSAGPSCGAARHPRMRVHRAAGRSSPSSPAWAAGVAAKAEADGGERCGRSSRDQTKTKPWFPTRSRAVFDIVEPRPYTSIQGNLDPAIVHGSGDGDARSADVRHRSSPAMARPLATPRRRHQRDHQPLEPQQPLSPSPKRRAAAAARVWTASTRSRWNPKCRCPRWARRHIPEVQFELYHGRPANMRHWIDSPPGRRTVQVSSATCRRRGFSTIQKAMLHSQSCRPADRSLTQ